MAIPELKLTATYRRKDGKEFAISSIVSSPATIKDIRGVGGMLGDEVALLIETLLSGIPGTREYKQRKKFLKVIGEWSEATL